MEKLALASAINPNPNFAGAPSNFVQRRCSFFPPSSQRERLASVRSKRFFVLAAKSTRIEAVSSRKISSNAFEKLKFQGFGSISSSTGQMSSATGTTPPVPPPPSYVGSPLFWVGIGVGLSALFSVAVTKIKQYALQQAFKTMMNQAPQSQTPGPPYTNPPFAFPFPPSSGAPTPGPASFYPPPPVQSKPEPKVTVDVKPTSRSDDVIIKKTEDSKKFSFVDVSPEKKEAEIPPPPKEVYKSVEPEVMGSTNGTAYKSTQSDSSQQSQSQASGGSTFMSVDQLEKMMEDPTVQKMVYPYLPEEMRNPTTFKWMLQNPQYRQQLQDMLNNMGGGQEWDNKMMDSLKNFDLSSPEVKQQFDQIGMTPEDVISKIMANPDMAVAFQNPRVQAAIMDCSQNPLNLAKYQNDKEVMDIFAKIAELFPGISG